MCNVVLILLENIAQVKTLCNIVFEAPGNNEQEKNYVQCCPNTLGTILHK